MIVQLATTQATIDAVAADRKLSQMASTLPVSKHNTVRPTIPFLRNIADWLAGNGLAGATISAAWQFWKLTTEYAEACREQNEINAELGYWFSVDPFQLDESQRLGLARSLPKMQCQETIHRGDYSSDDHKGIYELFLTAFGDEELARKMQTQAFKLYVEKCTRTGKGPK